MLNEFENKFWTINQYVLGIDEAGRGPLAGELVVAGVVLPIGYSNEMINDSKKLTPKKRQQLYEMIKQDAIEIIVEVVAVEKIDHLNIYQATKQAMQNIALRSKYAQYTITDAMPLELVNSSAIIKGDQKSTSIAAASIVAKVERDALMQQYHLQHPEYGFAQHKGYGTKKHIEAIYKYGVLPIHRKSYQPVKGIVENDSNTKR